jgi:hypothetical protein
MPFPPKKNDFFSSWLDVLPRARPSRLLAAPLASHAMASAARPGNMQASLTSFFFVCIRFFETCKILYKGNLQLSVEFLCDVWYGSN